MDDQFSFILSSSLAFETPFPSEFPMTFHVWNHTLHVYFVSQGRAVQTALSLEEGLKQVVHLDFIDQVHPEYHDKLVHLSGNLQTDTVFILGVVFSDWRDWRS